MEIGSISTMVVHNSIAVMMIVRVYHTSLYQPINVFIMTPLNICSGWWVSTDDRFVASYNTKEEAIAHVKYQKERMHSTKNWHVQYIKVEFKEYLTF